MNDGFSARREFLRFLAASPLIGRAFAQELNSTSAKDVLDVMEFEPLARKALPPAHWGYMATGVDDEVTLRMNREAFQNYQLRARRLVAGPLARGPAAQNNFHFLENQILRRVSS